MIRNPKSPILTRRDLMKRDLSKFNGARFDLGNGELLDLKFDATEPRMVVIPKILAWQSQAFAKIYGED